MLTERLPAVRALCVRLHRDYEGDGEHIPAGCGAGRAAHSHSMVPGGLLVTSSTTRLTPSTSLVMRFEMRDRTSSGIRAQSAVMASSLVTGRRTTGWP